MAYDLLQGDVDKTRGVWAAKPDMGGLTTIVSCPCCGFLINMSAYAINVKDRNLARPSLKCAVCNFDDFVRLVEWPGIIGKKS